MKHLRTIRPLSGVEEVPLLASAPCEEPILRPLARLSGCAYRVGATGGNDEIDSRDRWLLTSRF
jgi:hypothetical protein